MSHGCVSFLEGLLVMLLHIHMGGLHSWSRQEGFHMA